ncbi:LysR family transcriptional regulator [Robbsia sp. Bb-Pol-6]|uniref:LysR family transcriptional regulator n=1 Tax=Robbsia betulipollinis TaxID=2981849 RepID=A0ABT3ZSK0_9BURK|nr:LysR family transcriptional regulator [Robbsia betulipollinis]MCY0389205.1 LysR family transcriptional regulator [Robbsia betulipollinis]
MPKPPDTPQKARGPTLDQLQVFAAVADAGSFSLAAQRLERAQSAVSYTVANLEALLGLTLFERTRRRPVLTEAGRAILADARRVDTTMHDLQARAAGLTLGLEAEVSLAVDVMFPIDPLVGILEDFARVFPTVTLRLRMEPLGGVLKLVVERECELGISGPLGSWPDAIAPNLLGAISLISVAAPGHPLARRDGRIPTHELREHTQLVLTDRSRLAEGPMHGVYANHSWRIGDLGAKHRLLLAGLGWGGMPRHLVAADLAAGRLVRIRPADRHAFAYSLYLIARADTHPRPAARWLAERITALAPFDWPAPEAADADAPS